MTQQRTDEKKRRTRMCLATRTVLPESALMRFVVSPDDVVVPDLKAKLPGRGAWVRATRADLSDAIARKLLSRALKANAAIGDQLPDDVARVLKKAALGRLGLARKAGDVVTGFTKTASALASANALVLITASDGAPDGRRKIMAVRTRTAGDDAPVAHIDKIAGPELDLALGASNVIHAAVLQGS
ncbi:MAG: RNA-binding protein, partial [Alphaproteobacteria bacterium]